MMVNFDSSCPLFPQQPGSAAISSEGVGHEAGLDLPTLDLARLDRVGLVDVCSRLGVFRLANHGIPAALLASLFGLAHELLALPFEDKKNQPASTVAYFWGTPALSLQVKEVNWVEGFHILLSQVAHNKGPGSSTDATSQFRCIISEYGNHMARIARTIFDVIAVELGLDKEQSSTYLSESDGIFRVYRYPHCPSASEYLGMEAHTDSSVLSILNQDVVGGLQVLHNGTWCHVAPVPNTLLVNLGDMMQAMSSDRYKSVLHRVLASRARERLSLCYFGFPQDDSVIRGGLESKYRPFTYREFRDQVQADIKATGSKVGLERFAKFHGSST